jgi:hypothetical protein
MFKRVLALLLAPLQRWALKRLRSEHEVRGFRVVLDNTRPDVDSDAVLERFREAMDLLAEYQPWRFAHMQRDVGVFWIVRQPYRGSYTPGCDRVMTELTFLARRDISAAVVAASILHEGVHARIDHRRLRPESRDAAREERICRRAELAFGRALPETLRAPVIARAEASLALDDSEVAPEIDHELARARQSEIDREAFRAWRRGAA